MKTLIIYYSLTDNTKFIAEKIAKVVQADLLRLEPEQDLNPKGFMKFVWGGYQVLTKNEPTLKSFDINPNDYDLIIFGTPVWAGTYAPALQTFFSQYPITDKKIALFCCHGGGKGKVFEKMKKALPQNKMLGEIDFKDPLKHDEEACAKLAEAWAKDLLK